MSGYLGLFLAVAAAATATATATATAKPGTADRLTVLSLTAYLDENDTWSTDIGLDVPVGVHFRTFGTLGYSTLSLEPAPLTGAERDVGFAYGTAGLGYERGGFNTDLSLSLWGDDQVVATRDLRAGIGYDAERVGIRLTGVYRDVDFTVRQLVPDVGLVTEERSTNATGVGLELSASPSSQWRVYAGGETSDYDARLERLAARIPLRFLAQRQLTLSSTFPEWAWHAGTDVFFGAHRLNVEYTADKSIFGGLESSAASLAWQLPLGADGSWALDLRVGRARSDLSESATFGLASLTLLY